MKKKRAIPASQLEQMSQRLQEQQFVAAPEEEPDWEKAASVIGEEGVSFEDFPWEEDGEVEKDREIEEDIIAGESAREEEPQSEPDAGDPRIDLILHSVDELLGGVIYRWERIEQIVMRVVELVIRVYQLQAIVLKTLETGQTPAKSTETDDEAKVDLVGMLKTFLEGLEKPTS
ncbi:MAG: hypothetical protein ACOX20_00485 [Limnochordia bacterium]|jgi:hypothetical protein